MGVYTYNPGDLATSVKDQLRLMVGDTDPQNWFLADQEYEFFETVERNNWCAGARAAEAIGFLLTLKADVKLGRSLQVVMSKRADAYFKLAKWLRSKSMGTIVPYIGGAYVSDKTAQNANTDLLAPLFTKTQGQNPWTGGYDSDSLAPVGNDPSPSNDEGDDG